MFELPEERDHGVADGVMLLTSLCVAGVTWGYLAKIPSAPLWKFYGGVGLSFFPSPALRAARAGRA